MFSARVFAPESVDVYYRKNFGSERHLDGQRINAEVNFIALQRLVPIEQINTVMDVGCGYGSLLSKLQDTGKTVRGIELSEQEAAHGRGLGLEISEETIEDYCARGHTFDLVTCFEVIEHVRNPWSFTENLARLVKPSGYLVVMTDNFECKVVRAMGPAFPKWIPHTHISHFSARTFLSTFQALAGFGITDFLSFTPWELGLKRFLLNLRARRSAKESFSLKEAIGTEMQGRGRLTRARMLVNPIWFRISSRNDLSGQLMYVAAQRATSS